MVVIDEVNKYLEKIGRPVLREDLATEFEKRVSKKVLSDAIVVINREGSNRQAVRDPSLPKSSKVYYLPPSWAKEREDKKIPKDTAKGICLLGGSAQDVYVDLCFEHCPSVTSCAPSFRAYFKNNGIKWSYDVQEARAAKLKRFLGRKTGSI